MSLEVWLQIGVNLLALGVAYGALASKVATLERQNQQLRLDMIDTKRELNGEILRLRDKYHDLAPLEPTLQQFIKLIRDRK